MQNWISKLAFLFIALWFGWELSHHFPNNVLSWDTYGAYLHLPANFIYGDPFLTDWSWIEAMNEKYNATPSYYQFWEAETGRQVIKYPMGFAVIYAPFFFVGHWLAPSLGYAQDGFSEPYQWAIIAGHCFYVLLGLWFARKVLLHYFSERTTAILLLMLFAGTNFFFTTTVMIAMPHGHLFLFYALLLLFTIRWHKQTNWFNSVCLGLVIGTAALIRATEILMALIPILWNVSNKETLKQKWLWVKAHKNQVFLVAFVVFSMGSIQLIYYKLTTGHFFVDAYNNAGEGFDFFSPHTFNFLFSARKGWLVYTPILIFSFVGFWLMKRKSHHDFLPLFVFAALNIYLLSSWTCWWYAESFGQRAVVQSYLILLIPLGFFLEYLFKQSFWKQSSFGILILIFVGLNQFQTWQLHHGLIHPSRMTHDAYWAHFLKTEAHPNFETLLLVDKNVPARERLKNDNNLKVILSKRFAYNNQTWQEIDFLNGDYLIGDSLYSGKEFSSDIRFNGNFVPNKSNVIFKITAMVYFTGEVQEIRPKLVAKWMHKEIPFYDHYLHVEEVYQLTPNEWNQIELVDYVPEIRNRNHTTFQIFGWMAGSGAYKLDDITLTVHEGLR